MRRRRVKTVNQVEISLIDELLAIHDGACVYCQHGIAHPTYSRCSNSKALVDRCIINVSVA